jgi:capsule polysaccharide export protein KpsE/RkpR
LESHALLEPIVSDTITIPELARVETIEALLRAGGKSQRERAQRATRSVQKLIDAKEDRHLSAVILTAKTKWPSVSYQLVVRLLRALDRFNAEARQSQASAERQFAETAAAEAERSLRNAEDQLQDFLQQNREIAGSPSLQFARDRLQREVALRQQVYTTLLQSREDARLREVRDTPVITIIDAPEFPAIPDSRGLARRLMIGVVVGGLAGLGIVWLGQQMPMSVPLTNGGAWERWSRRLLNSMQRRSA